MGERGIEWLFGSDGGWIGLGGGDFLENMIFFVHERAQSVGLLSSFIPSKNPSIDKRGFWT